MQKYALEAVIKENAELKAENERLEELKCNFKEYYCTCNTEKYVQCLQEIKEIAEFHITDADSEDVQNDMKQILDLITKAEVENE